VLSQELNRGGPRAGTGVAVLKGKEVERMRQEVEAAAVMPRDPGLPAIHTINT